MILALTNQKSTLALLPFKTYDEPFARAEVAFKIVCVESIHIHIRSACGISLCAFHSSKLACIWRARVFNSFSWKSDLLAVAICLGNDSYTGSAALWQKDREGQEGNWHEVMAIPWSYGEEGPHGRAYPQMLSGRPFWLPSLCKMHALY